jgi:DNA-binding HxlR family transcriptional regulator
VTASTELHLPDSCKEVSETLARVGDKWSVLIVMLLGDGPRRFNELKRMIGGISQRMLTLTLRGLERDGLVTRTMFATIPPRVDYELTPWGTPYGSRSRRWGRGRTPPSPRSRGRGRRSIARVQRVEAPISRLTTAAA